MFEGLSKIRPRIFWVVFRGAVRGCNLPAEEAGGLNFTQGNIREQGVEQSEIKEVPLTISLQFTVVAFLLPPINLPPPSLDYTVSETCQHCIQNGN